MKRNQKLQKRSAIAKNALLFVSAVLIMLFLYPDTLRFGYDFRRGEPWVYETLYAPFDFAVRKSPEKIAQERLALEAERVAYYNYAENVADENLQKAVQDSTVLSEEIKLLRQIYQRGIIEKAVSKNPQIYLIKDRIGSQNDIGDFFTMETARDYLNTNSADSSVRAILYLSPNILYDAQKTKEASDGAENITLYAGQVQTNEKVVGKGELVTDESYLVLESLREAYQNRIGESTSLYYIRIGQLAYVAACMLLLFFYLKINRSHIFFDTRKVLFILTLVLVFVALTAIAKQFDPIEIFVIPYILLAVFMRTFLDSRTAFFVYIITILLSSYTLSNDFEFVAIQLITGSIAILNLAQLEKRVDLLITAFWVILSYSLLYTLFYIRGEGDLAGINPLVYARFCVNGILITLAYPLLHLMEKAFGLVSNVTLIELTNSNNKLLRKLSEVAPGTFQHSMQMGNLAEAAIRKIGGNTLLVRAGALYHDIGKIENPMYFTENQHGDLSPHLNLSNEESAAVIIQHVADGIKLAKKHSLPKEIMEFISAHHGRGRTEYFYRMAVNKKPEEEVDAQLYTYPGFNPTTKEQAVLMMADACEAASRSLKEKSEENIRALVNKLIDDQKAQGYFDEAPITFKDIKMVKEVFVEMLSNIYHARIVYPEKQEAED